MLAPPERLPVRMRRHRRGARSRMSSPTSASYSRASAPSTARRARTVRRSAEPGPAPTSITLGCSGGIAGDLLGLAGTGVGGEQPADLGTAGAAIGPRRGGRADLIDVGRAGLDGRGDGP